MDGWKVDIIGRATGDSFFRQKSGDRIGFDGNCGCGCLARTGFSSGRVVV